MAFVTVEQWSGAPQSEGTGSPTPPEHSAGNRMRRTAVLALSLLAHGVLLSLLVTGKSQPVGSGPSPTMTLIDLSPSSPSSETSPPAQTEPVQAKPAPLSTSVDSAPSPLPAEWSMSKIPEPAAPVAEPAAAAPSPPALPPAPAQAGGTGAQGAGSGGGYDPYAGAAPDWSMMQAHPNAQLSPPAASQLALPPPPLEQLRQRFAASHRGISGTLTFRPIFNSSGRIGSIEIVRTTLPPKIVAELETLLVGLRIAPQLTFELSLP